MITIPKISKRPTSYSLGDTTQNSGANSLVQPERLSSGSAQDILNMLWDGGSLTVRPGFTGQLTTAHGAAVYLSRVRYTLFSGTARIPYTTGGKIYYWEEGATAGVEIKKPGAISFSMTSSAVRWCVVGEFLYFLDSADTAGTLWRVNLESTTTAEAVRGFTAPVEAPVAALRDGSVLVSSFGTKTWSGTTGSGTNLIASGDRDFQGATGFWEFTSGAATANNLDADGGSAPCVELDANTGDIDYVHFTTPASLPANTSRILYVTARYAATENTGTSDSAQVLRVRVYGCNSSGDRVVTLEKDSVGANQSPTQVFRGVFDFRAYPEVTKVDVEFSCPTASGTKGVDVRQVSAQAPPKNYGVTNSSGTAVLTQGDLLVFSSTLYCANVPALVTITSANYSAFDSVSADVKMGEKVTTPLSMRLGFKVGSTWFYSQPATVTGESVSFDTSLIKESLTAVVQLAFEPLNDVFITDSVDAGTSEVFRVSTLRTPGNLTNLLNYSYVWAQAKDSTATVEGSGSPFSGFVEASRDKARVVLSLKGASGTAPTLDSGASYIPIYRLGGATPDGDSRARRIAIVQSGVDSASPAGTTQDDPTNLWFWDASEWAFYDNTPDDSLTDAAVYQISRDMVPLGATAIRHHAGRLWLGVYDSTYKVNRLYASWLLDGINTWPYMSEATDPTDAELDIKGWLAGVGGVGSGDRIVGLGTINLDPQNNRGASLSVLRQSAPPSLVSGWTPSDFALNPAPDNRGGGCVAPEGMEQVNGTTVYVAAIGSVQSMGIGLAYLSETQEGAFGLEALGKTRYSQTFLLWHARRLWAIYPGTSGTLGEARVWDERTGTWSRVSGYNGLGFTSGCSLSGGEDTGAVYFGGRDGQIYLMAGTVMSPTASVDKATPSGTARAISWSFRSRRHGQRDAETRIRYAFNRVNALLVDFYAASAFSLSWSIANENSETSAGTYGIRAGRTTKNEIREIADVRGAVHDVALSGSTSAKTTLHSYVLETADLGETR